VRWREKEAKRKGRTVLPIVTEYWFLENFGEVALKFTARKAQKMMLIKDMHNTCKDIRMHEAERKGSRR
jgi:hypothetical protein